ncbi:hypothetical protein HYH02_006938 [Chlamydomonas schloesseri]|uniref:Protein kinase domain-containing protein n=1 Tax=Chlamydomonas schloesseri TaxID=2026947 RepID=A0A836B5M0_9CHLO|nr:hypothetical protein HYH02_006938 [Chlamydomonas schloesseri]|eukprot:KAG2448356.1 hypothetical protein HYH02_006938 [Chlamydomonas schloesseri]
MSMRRKSVDFGAGDLPPGSPSGRGKMQNALLKLSTANAFAKGSWKPPQAARGSVDLQGGEEGGHGDGVFPYSDADLDAMMPPQVLQPVSPFYGMYSDYEEVMDLLHTAVMADGSSRSTLQRIPRDHVVHVAHLGLGACCTVDLVAVHGSPDGSRLLAAAKSCYLPPNDPRMKASFKEAELLRRCADCPFIMQLLSVIQYNPLDDVPAAGGASAFAAAAAKASFEGGSLSRSGSIASPHGFMQGQASLQSYDLGALGGQHDSMVDSAATEVAGGGAWASAGQLASGGHSGQLVHMPSGGFAQPGASFSAAPSFNSPGYQAWEQWRGGGTENDVEQQIRQRMASMSDLRRNSLSLSVTSQGSFSMGTGAPGWDAAGMVGAAASAYGGGWRYGQGGGGTIGTCGLDSPTGGRQVQRRGSIEILEMYGGTGFCATGLGVGTGGGTTGWGQAGGGGGDGGQARGGPNAPIMYTLLVGWARCGDLRRLVQLQLAKNGAQAKQNAGQHTPVTAMHPVICEDASRFYVGCLLLALEHLHCRLNTVHRDLKLANLLLLGNGYAIVGDLGTAVDLSTVPNGRLTSRVGSPGHMAPECQHRDEGGYDLAADMWSVGACLFSLLTGTLPAGVAGPPSRSWTPPLSRHWSHELQDFLTRLLAWSPRDRPTVAHAMKDPWFRGFNWGALRSQKMPPPSNTPWRELLWWPKVNRALM